MTRDLPAGWTKTALRELAQFNPRHPRGLDDRMPVSFVPMAAVNESSPKLTLSQKRALGDVRQGFTHFVDGDVLFAKITPCMENGKGAVAERLTNGIACGSTELVVLRSAGAVDPHYLYRFLAQASVRADAKDHFTSTAGQARVPLSFLQELEIPLAPLVEQRRIVTKLEQLLGQVGGCQQRLAKVAVHLKRFRQSVLAAACTGRLTEKWRAEHPEQSGYSVLKAMAKSRGRSLDVSDQPDELWPEIPKAWAWVRLELLLRDERSLSYGILKPGEPDPAGVPMLRVMDIGDGTLNATQIVKVNPRLAAEYKRTRLETGDVLLAVMATIGRSMVVSEQLAGANVNRALAVLKLSKTVNPNYICMVIRSPYFQQLFASEKLGSAQARINLSDLRTFVLPLPSRPEQDAIVERVDAILAVVAAANRRITLANTCADKLIPALLAKAFRGDLVPTEADLARQEGRDYEPATVLLERVQQQRIRDEDATPRPSARASTTARKIKRTARSSRRALMTR